MAFVAALLIRLVSAWTCGPAAPQEIRYIAIAQGLLQGRGFEGIDNRFPDIIQPPTYPWLIAAAMPVLREPLASARGLSVLAGALLVFPVSILTRRIFGSPAAKRAAWLVAVYPLLVHISGLAMTEPTFGLLVASAAVCFHRLGEREGGAGRAAVAGALLGFAFLTRPEGITYLAAGSSLLFISLWLSHRRPLSQAIGLAAVPLIALVIVAAPYSIWLHGKTDRWLIAPKAILTQAHNKIMSEGLKENWPEPYGTAVFYERVKFGLNAEGTELRSAEVFRSLGLVSDGGTPPQRAGGLRDLFDLERLAGIVVRNLRRLYLTTVKYGLVMPTLLIGFIALGMTARPWRKGSGRRGSFTLLWWLIAGGSWALAYVQPRFLYSSVLFLLPWMGMGWVRIEEWLKDSLSRPAGRPRRLLGRAVSPAIAVVVALAALVHAVPPAREISSQWVQHHAAGIWLEENGAPGSTVMALTPVASFYAGMSFDVLPYADPAQVLAYARLRGVRYLIADSRECSLWRPQLLPLLDRGAARAGLEAALVLGRKPGRRLILYDLEPGPPGGSPPADRAD